MFNSKYFIIIILYLVNKNSTVNIVEQFMKQYFFIKSKMLTFWNCYNIKQNVPKNQYEFVNINNNKKKKQEV